MIDGGPLRISRPTTRQATYRNETVRRQPQEPEPMEQGMSVDQPPQRTVQYRQEESERPAPARPKDLSWLKWVVIGFLAAGLLAVGWFFLSDKPVAVDDTIDTNKYQAVFLSNGQVYFGKLAIISGDYMKLTNVYYLERQLTAGGEEASEGDAAQNPTDNNFQLLKYSDVLYGSEDAMVISKADVIRYENLRPDGVVARAIANRQ